MMAVGVGEGDRDKAATGVVGVGDGDGDGDGLADGADVGSVVAGSVVDCLIQSGGVPVCSTGQES